MGRVKFRCPHCGAHRFKFTVRNEGQMTPHGAVCCRCARPVQADNLYHIHLAYRRKSWSEKD